jgi:hypothetical protein
MLPFTPVQETRNFVVVLLLLLVAIHLGQPPVDGHDFVGLGDRGLEVRGRGTSGNRISRTLRSGQNVGGMVYAVITTILADVIFRRTCA